MLYSAHLHTHSVYTKGNSTLELSDLVRRAKSFGMTHTALVDSGNIDGFEPFSILCKTEGVLPIYGCGFYHVSSATQSINHTVVLAKNRVAFENIVSLLALSKKQVSKGKPTITDEQLAEFSEGLFCLSGGLGGEIDKLILTKSYELAENRIQFYQSIFKQDYYLELQDHGSEKNRLVLSVLQKMSLNLKVQTVVTQGAFFLDRKDFDACNQLRKMNGNRELPNENYLFRSPQEMECLFRYTPKSLLNINKIVDQIEQFSINL
ncbi:MAG: PHP domain-containing protein [Lentisphaeria bacterium]|nr:PHP domain-containing protein [Lentisphaeria bacterium]